MGRLLTARPSGKHLSGLGHCLHCQNYSKKILSVSVRDALREATFHHMREELELEVKVPGGFAEAIESFGSVRHERRESGSSRDRPF